MLQADSEGDTINLSSLVAQLFEFLLTMAASKRFQSLLGSNLRELVYVSIGQCNNPAANPGVSGVISKSVRKAVHVQ